MRSELAYLIAFITAVAVFLSWRWVKGQRSGSESVARSSSRLEDDFQLRSQPRPLKDLYYTPKQHRRRRERP